ncbi:MAG: hypothetical protein WA802_17240 [Terracidiphilus sp.]|jgi:hypothetical protein
MRNTLLLGCVVGICCASFAQSNQSSWANLSGLHAGQKIQIVEMNSKKHTGIFESVSDFAISVKDATAEISVRKQDVRSVKLLSSGHHLRNTLIGLGVGAGAGAGISAAAWESHGFIGGKGVGAAFGAAIGGLGGTIVGALLPAHDTIYRVSSN